MWKVVRRALAIPVLEWRANARRSEQVQILLSRKAYETIYINRAIA